jgi:hypothetical protein
MSEEYTGVEGASVAGEQQTQQQQETQKEQTDLFSFLEEEQTGVDNSAVAEQDNEEGEEEGEQRVEQAFAKRLAQEREKIRRELEQEYQQRYQEPMPNRQLPPQQPEKSIEERAQELAEEWMITPEAAKAIILQEERIKDLTTRLYMMDDNATKMEAKAAVERQRVNNPYLPPFDEQELLNIRLRHYNQYGVLPKWEDAYKMYVADAVAKGEINKNIEQQVISRITGRDKVNVQVGQAEKPKKRNIWDLSDEEFEKLKEKAKRGELKKT